MDTTSWIYGVMCATLSHRIFWSVAKAAVLLTRVSPTGRRKYRGYIPDPGDTDQGLRIRVFFVGQIRILKRLNPISYSKRSDPDPSINLRSDFSSNIRWLKLRYSINISIVSKEKGTTLNILISGPDSTFIKGRLWLLSERKPVDTDHTPIILYYINPPHTHSHTRLNIGLCVYVFIWTFIHYFAKYVVTSLGYT